MTEISDVYGLKLQRVTVSRILSEDSEEPSVTVISLIPSKWDAPPKRSATNTRKRFMPRLVGPAFASPLLPPLNGPSAARSLFCLAPHGVFRAPPVA